MATLALVLICVWLLVVGPLRAALFVARTGNADALRLHLPQRAADWLAGLVSSLGFGFAVAAPVVELLGWAPVAVLDRPAVRVAGAVIVVAGIGATFAAQSAMGESWRVAVDPDERTRLVTTGPFRWVRNPIFTATGATFVGVALLVPHPLALPMLALVWAAIELQVRLVEEPYLDRVHGAAWEAYAARTGRFVPRLGRIPPRTTVHNEAS